jgi:hypothetical protein
MLGDFCECLKDVCLSWDIFWNNPQENFGEIQRQEIDAARNMNDLVFARLERQLYIKAKQQCLDEHWKKLAGAVAQQTVYDRN